MHRKFGNRKNSAENEKKDTFGFRPKAKWVAESEAESGGDAKLYNLVWLHKQGAQATYTISK